MGFLSLISINRITESNDVITKQEVPRLISAEEALLSMVRSIESLSLFFEIEDPSMMEEAKSHESAVKVNILRFDMFLKALTWGSETDAFANVAGGIIKSQWQQLGLNKTIVVEEPTAAQAQLAGVVSIYFNAFAQHSNDAIKHYNDYLRWLSVGNIEAAEEAKETAFQNKESSYEFFDLTLGAIDDLVKASNEEVQDSLRNIETIQGYAILGVLFMSILGFLIALLFSNFFANRVIKGPLSKLVLAVERIGEGDLSKKAEVVSSDEIGQLAGAFNKMTTKLDGSYKQLTREKTKLQTTLESIGDGAFVIDKEGKIIFFNKMAEQLTGYKKKSALGKPYRKIVKFMNEKSGLEEYSFVDLALKKGKIGRLSDHNLLISKGGKKVPVVNSAAPIRDERGVISSSIVLFRDMTHEYEADKMKTEFISLASHQLRTPLTAIRWFAEILLDEDLGKLNEKQKHCVMDARASIIRMTGLVSGLLNVSRIESGKLAVNYGAIDVSKFVDGLFTELTPIARGKKQKLIFQKAESISEITTDSRLLQEILMNLMSNAIKYSPEKKEIKLNISDEGNKTLFEVIDNGYGIPKDQQKNIFKKFFRADNAAKIETDGSGLGLYLVKKLVEAIGGNIWFESDNAGTKFAFKIPAIYAEQSKPKVSNRTK